MVAIYSHSFECICGFASRLFLRLLEDHVLAEFGTVLLEFDLALDQLFILAGPIGLARRFVLDLYEFVL